MRYVVLILGVFAIFSGFLFGAEHKPLNIAETDIFQRVINFVIFVALMWYLVADKIKAVLKNRSRAIADKLSQTQAKVQESRHKKEKAQQRLKETNKQTAETLRIAKQEAALAAQRIDEKTKEQVASMIKANEEAMEFQERLFQKQIVNEILQESFQSPTLKIDSKDYVGILEKKVA